MSLDLDLIAAIDARISAGQQRLTAMGTVAALTGDNDALVTFDGSTVAIPVKITGETILAEGDRVCLLRVGIWWIVVGTLSRRWTSHSGTSVQMTSGTTTSSSYADLPAAVSVPFEKKRDATRAYVKISASGFSTGVDTEAFWGANFSAPDQPAIATIGVVSIFWNPANTHLRAVDWRHVTGLAAGVYTVKAQWLRNSGTGTVTVDSKDRIAIDVMEVSPT